MTTVTGTINDASDNPLRALLTFQPTSAPYIEGSGKIISAQSIQLFSNASDGSFSVALEAGTYNVTIGTNPQSTFGIVVPGTGGPYTIDQLAGLPAPSPVYTPSGSGSPQGVVTAPAGSPYWDATGTAFWIKASGTGNTGWQMLIQL